MVFYFTAMRQFLMRMTSELPPRRRLGFAICDHEDTARRLRSNNQKYSGGPNSLPFQLRFK